MNCQAKIFIADSRNMAEVESESVDLIVTSPPYWHIKDYGVEGQIGYGQSLHEYLLDLSRVWRECFRVLKHGRRLCINIGDQFARAIVYGRYKVIPLHAEVIAQCETIGFDYMGAIIWQKKTTMRTTGGAVVMGSFPYPPNGIVELDYEFVLLFKKPGEPAPVPQELKEASKLTRDEWKSFFTGHWQLTGERQVLHEAMFPEELPRRLIRMFSFVGDMVLDPFVGSGTTVKVALELRRNAIGYEIQPAFVPIIQQKLGISERSLLSPPVTIVHRTNPLPALEPPPHYTPRVKDAKPLVNPKQLRFGDESTYKVTAVIDELTLRIDNGLTVRLLGIVVPPERKAQALTYLRQFVLGKRVLLKFDRPPEADGAPLPAYLYLTNRLFVNRKMIEMGLANADRTTHHRYRAKFLEAEAKRHG
ncbi:MAG: DNA methyltransferase [Candidatus Fervidibacter sp.]|uniref:DNA methyltransferase n=1 Tax=Candidatus Fervidibacter sp. TaxID=3100871 RepID=UPI00404971DB